MCKPNTNLYCPKGAHCAKPVQDNKQVHLHGHVHAVLIVKYCNAVSHSTSTQIQITGILLLLLRKILLYTRKTHYKCINIYNKYMYKLSGVLNYGMTIKRFNIPDNLHVHLLYMFMHLNAFFRCTKEFL